MVIDAMASPGVLAVAGSRGEIELTMSMPTVTSPNTA